MTNTVTITDPATLQAHLREVLRASDAAVADVMELIADLFECSWPHTAACVREILDRYEDLVCEIVLAHMQFSTISDLSAFIADTYDVGHGTAQRAAAGVAALLACPWPHSTDCVVPVMATWEADMRDIIRAVENQPAQS